MNAAIEVELRRILQAARTAYGSAIGERALSIAHQQGLSVEAWRDRMEQLSQGLMMKVCTELTSCDGHWTANELQLIGRLAEFYWGSTIADFELRAAAQRLTEQARQLQWPALVGPFVRHDSLRDLRSSVLTVAMRMANLSAKVDGRLTEAASQKLGSLQRELEEALQLGSIQTPAERSYAEPCGPYRSTEATPDDLAGLPMVQSSRNEQLLAQAQTELRRLVGLRQAKRQVQELTDLLSFQQHRQRLGLPTEQQSLHMMFSGNPGTGKTTVARIVAEIMAGLGLLTSGHLVETDRSGLVAQYAGQTAHRTNALIDQALDGILFIDEAYSLVDSQGGDDSYGREAIQVLLKRMEDDRHRLVVILAGYPKPLEALVRSNPGLSSRIGTHLHFDDYTPTQLLGIFRRQAAQQKYDLPPEVMVQALRGFHWLHARRDEHFGNGRVVRNVFEATVRRMASRIAGITPVTHRLLTELLSEDLLFPDIPAQDWAGVSRESIRVRLRCQACSRQLSLPDTELLSQPICPACGKSVRGR